jgi:hypothetical protein
MRPISNRVQADFTGEKWCESSGVTGDSNFRLTKAICEYYFRSHDYVIVSSVGQTQEAILERNGHGIRIWRSLGWAKSAGS